MTATPRTRAASCLTTFSLVFPPPFTCLFLDCELLFKKFCLFIFGCAGSSLLHAGYSLVAARGLLNVVASLVEGHRLEVQALQWPQLIGSVVVAYRLSCSAACEIFPNQGLNPCPLHWQADS